MRSKSLRAITTRYNGYAFRSRLEARWAVFLDHLGYKWEYEPEGFELGNGLRYLPDFWLPEWDMWLEIKPDEPDSVTLEKAGRLAVQSQKPVFISCGLPGQGGTLVTSASALTDAVLSIDAEADWGAVGDNHMWLFSDTMSQEDTMVLAWGGCDYGVTPTRLKGQLRTPWMDEPLNRAKEARFEFGAKGAI
jgi:hypothetical protein